jgi:plasmid stabilization system protein ParE
MIDATQQYIERLERVVALGVNMRRLRRVCDRIPSERALDAVRVAEQMFDKATAQLKTPGLPL